MTASTPSGSVRCPSRMSASVVQPARLASPGTPTRSARRGRPHRRRWRRGRSVRWRRCPWVHNSDQGAAQAETRVTRPLPLGSGRMVHVLSSRVLLRPADPDRSRAFYGEQLALPALPRVRHGPGPRNRLLPRRRLPGGLRPLRRTALPRRTAVAPGRGRGRRTRGTAGEGRRDRPPTAEGTLGPGRDVDHGPGRNPDRPGGGACGSPAAIPPGHLGPRRPGRPFRAGWPGSRAGLSVLGGELSAEGTP